ncbi:PLC-like phosphodiesterase [Tricharina praecox]|uniref:PLC-like phosphodiesterase n=1 Tax=Tricharina praecox TaxID=43433 RepID=UPI00222012F4|nr:PLC-like phosphodiesterase [Tricharina praecox]KAI5857114.1 PLC-like phosphodiesterase [Tricharina praecox]
MVRSRPLFARVLLALLLSCCFTSGDIPASSSTHLTTTSTRTRTTTVAELVLSGTNSDTADDEPTPTPTASGNETEIIVSASGASSSSDDEPTTTEPPGPVNTQPCNLYVEFCTRSYGNITYVGTHNSPFVRQNNAASNQRLDVVAQLNDGVRMLQGQAHKANGTMYYCHTSCDLLNAGTVEDYLKRVYDWLMAHPYEIVTILIGNGGFDAIDDFVAPVEDSGLSKLAYVPDNRTIAYNEWPTLSELILKGKRAIIFVDYKADENKVPYLLDEFTYMWETPFSQTNQDFPCNVDRPPDQNATEAARKMYMANHNLNVEFTAFGTVALVPNTIAINQTNGVDGYGSLGLQSENCEVMWTRPPNFLLVDFYDAGNGSVFEVAAKANGVTYPGGCCGKVKSAALSIIVAES